METYCFGYKKNTANETYNHRKTKQNRLMLKDENKDNRTNFY